jgi:hypothetical protein
MPSHYPYIAFIQERRTSTSRSASCCACLALLLLTIAAFMPMWVVTSFYGHAKLLAVNMNVDLVVGDGLFKRNVCYGDSRPDEELMQRFGLTCKGSLQTAGCDDQSDLTNAEKDHCDDFMLLQAFATASLFFVFVGLIFSGMAAHLRFQLFRTFLRIGALACMSLALMSACVTVSLVHESDMVQDIPLQCNDVFGDAHLCRRYGASMVLQWLAIVALMFAVVNNLMLLCCVSDEEIKTARIPLLADPNSGIVYSTST